MFVKRMQVVSMLMITISLPMLGACASCKRGSLLANTCAADGPEVKPASMSVASNLPVDPVPGECYAQVFVPPKFETVSEKICVREAYEKCEVVPAKYEWVDEQVVVKDATVQLEFVPAEYEVQERTIETSPGHTEWTLEKSARCKSEGGQPVQEVFCLVKTPPVVKTLRKECLVKPAAVKETTIPAEYETVRRQKLVCPATTRKVMVPAEYETIDKTIKVADGGMQWEKVICERDASAEFVNSVKEALLSAGYATDPLNGELSERDWAAIRAFQQNTGLGVGALTAKTVVELGIGTH